MTNSLYIYSSFTTTWQWIFSIRDLSFIQLSSEINGAISEILQQNFFFVAWNLFGNTLTKYQKMYFIESLQRKSGKFVSVLKCSLTMKILMNGVKMGMWNLCKCQFSRSKINTKLFSNFSNLAFRFCAGYYDELCICQNIIFVPRH